MSRDTQSRLSELVSSGLKARWRGKYYDGIDLERGDMVVSSSALYIFTGHKGLAAPPPPSGPYELVLASAAGMTPTQIISAIDSVLGAAWHDTPEDFFGTDLDAIADADSVEVTSSTGNSVILEGASESTAGVMTAADKKITNKYPNLDEQHQAGAALADQFMVVTEHDDGTVHPADVTDIADAYRLLGVALAPAVLGGDVTVRIGGRITDPSFSFTPGQLVFVGLASELTQTAPGDTRAFNCAIGMATAADSVVIRMFQPVENA
jgi:hypothetical protein